MKIKSLSKCHEFLSEISIFCKPPADMIFIIHWGIFDF